ncbi:hypothetical protein IP81_19470 [Novosphingobium sp. AAP83]|nr:hypothetical protein IP81_19470 [Novosphingobium sp. AAP83]
MRMRMMRTVSGWAGWPDIGSVLVLGLWLPLIFLMGGSARPDVASLIVLRPLAIVSFGMVMYCAPRRLIFRNYAVLGWAGAVLLLPALQLVPLPPVIWQALPGREIIVDIDRYAGMGGLYRSLSMTPEATWNALWSLFVPASVFGLMLTLDRAEQHFRVLDILILVGVGSAILACLQMGSDPKGALYFYSVTNPGSGVGFFANRNHQAVFLALLAPAILLHARIKAFQAAQKNQSLEAGRTVFPVPWWIIPGCAVMLLAPLLLVTGSRSGLVLGMVAALATPWVIAPLAQQRTRSMGRRVLPTLALLAGLAFVMFDRDLALDRLFASDPASDARMLILPTVFAMIEDVWLLGTGLGSFETVMMIYEPDHLLAPNYMNHAHNDWLEIVLTGGVPAIVLGLMGGWIICRGMLRHERYAEVPAELALSRLGFLMIIILALASFSDYPLRTPALMSVIVIALVWVTKNQNFSLAKIHKSI